MTGKISEEAHNSRERHAFKGTIDGQADLSNVHTITDGTNRYYLVSGDVTTDPATGRITGSTSGLIIGMDLDGSFVQLNESDGYMVEPVTQTLDQFEEAERERLGQQVTQVIDPNGTMAPQVQQGGTLDNAGGEAGVNGDTGGNTTSATAPADNTVGAEVAAEWLLGSGQNAINSTDYLLKALSGVFPKATQAIEAIRQKYAQQIANDPALAEIKDFMNSPLRNQIVAEIKEAINQAYPNNAEVQDIFDIIMQHPTGLPSRIGQEVQRKLDSLTTDKGNGQVDPRTMPDEEKQRRGEMLKNAPAIDVAANQIVATPTMSARKAAEAWWDEHVPEPQFFDTEIGEVEINRNSVESSLAHRYGQAKLDAITSLVEGFENAVYLGTLPDSTRQEGVLDHYFAYPIMYNGQRCYVFCRALQDNNANRLYVHEVFIAENIKKGDALQTAASQPHGGISLYRDILANVLDSAGKDTNNSDTNQGIDVKVDKNGVKLYEQGTPIDAAIDDIQRDGYDPGQFADLAISEAQGELSKMKQPKTRAELVNNNARRKELQNTIDYYNNVKARLAEMNRPAETAQSPAEAPASPSGMSVEEQKQQRIADAKAKYGELFDDDFTKANDVYELVSMWVGRKRNLAWDDVNGKRGLQKELGWTRKIGGDTKYIETLLAKKGEGMGVDEFVHTVWESHENSIGEDKRFSTEEIKEALLDLLKSAQSKSDVVDYALNTRIALAENTLRQQEEALAAQQEPSVPSEEAPVPDDPLWQALFQRIE